MDVTMKGALAALKLSVLRTLIPVLVTVLVGILAKANIHLDSTTAEVIVTNVIGVVGGVVYYVGVRILESIKSSKWGWLLGAPNAPVYPDEKGVSGALDGATVVVEPGTVDTAKLDTPPLMTDEELLAEKQ